MSKKIIKILIADDHHLIRNGIKNMLSTDETYDVIEEAENGVEALSMTKELKPDIVIMDVAMPKMNGIEATEAIKKQAPDTKILILTMHENEEYIVKLFNAGASGYILKNAKMPEFLTALKAIAQGETYFSSDITQIILNGYKDKEDDKESQYEDLAILTDREKEIIKLVADGLSNKEIGSQLFISVRTVETHRKNLMKKLQVKNTAEIIKYAIHKGLVSY